jgi:Mycoplasma protein of unknown function, DUF285
MASLGRVSESLIWVGSNLWLLFYLTLLLLFFWVSKKVERMIAMFYEASSFNQDISGWVRASQCLQLIVYASLLDSENKLVASLGCFSESQK